VQSLIKHVSTEWPDAQLQLYGSFAKSFGTSHNNVDVGLEMENGTESTAEVLLKLADVLKTQNFDNVDKPSLSFTFQLCSILIQNHLS
jgi:DNA polymerase sigma